MKKSLIRFCACLSVGGALLTTIGCARAMRETIVGGLAVEGIAEGFRQANAQPYVPPQPYYLAR
jgi:hypothetical protein